MADLAHVLRHLPVLSDPNLLVGDHPADDAAVYRLSDELALVQTVDFFTPIVDDPYLFGQIAAANSLSDVYAVGGTPITALNIVTFPRATLPLEVLGEILRGGADMARQAGVTIVGGHTVDDTEPKYGLAVTGTVHPGRYLSPRGGKPGDLLVLTKPIGTGAISTALKSGAASESDVTAAVRWMTALNRDASEGALRAGAAACTDVTGFGLLGHLADLCNASGVSAVLDPLAVPLLPGARRYVREGFVPGGTGTNLDALDGRMHVDSDISDDWLRLLADPQTSGGLLIALSPEHLPALRRAESATVLTAPVGWLIEGEPGVVSVAFDSATH